MPVLKLVGITLAACLGLALLFYVGPAIFEAAAPTGGRLMKFAVQRHRGVAIGAVILLVGLYSGIAVLGCCQRPVEAAAASNAESNEV